MRSIFGGRRIRSHCQSLAQASGQRLRPHCATSGGSPRGQFIRPSICAAVELGSDTLANSRSRVAGANTREFLEALRAALITPKLRVAGIARFGRTWRRFFFGMVMDRETPVREIEDGLRALLRGLLVEAPDSVEERTGVLLRPMSSGATLEASPLPSRSGRSVAEPRQLRCSPTHPHRPVPSTKPLIEALRLP